MAESRSDLVHPFQWLPGRESECSHFYFWLGSQVKCLAKESDSIHRSGTHILTARNGEQAYCAGSPETCEACFQEARLSKLNEERTDKIARRKRFRPFGSMSGADFGEAMADMAKAVERSRQQK